MERSLARDLLEKLCNPNVLNRYSASEAMQHPWITGYTFQHRKLVVGTCHQQRR